MLVYGLTNEANDLWDEQIVKRGWTDWQIPDVLQPSASAAWAAMLAVAVLLFLTLLRPETAQSNQRSGRSRTSERCRN